MVERVHNVAEFGRVAVLMGGVSAERDISLMTGKAVHKALLARGVDAHALDVGTDVYPLLSGGKFDRVWIALHGPGGEDGTLQGLLSMMGMPFTGSGVLGSAICMDKLRTKQLLKGAGFATPDFCALSHEDELGSIAETVGFPVMVKPAADGSSIGMSRVDTASQLPAAYRLASQHSPLVLAEQWVEGPEYTAGILHDQVLPLIRIKAAEGFYDYEAKYFREDTSYICPCGLPEQQERALAQTCKGVFDVLGATGWGRVDFMLDDSGVALVLEANTVPGMTSHSLVPMAAAQAGIDFEELVWRVLETSFASAERQPEVLAEAGEDYGA
ncbi:MAG: D-alanine--D-alanine ligase [Gammaproteobacteria bacterium]